MVRDVALVLTMAVEVEGVLGSINCNGDGSNIGHSVLEGTFIVPPNSHVASGGGSNIILIEAALTILSSDET